ncbi:hypothetical protein SMU105_00005, partial [Streptococcus mutans SF12]
FFGSANFDFNFLYLRAERILNETFLRDKSSRNVDVSATWRI